MIPASSNSKVSASFKEGAGQCAKAQLHTRQEGTSADPGPKLPPLPSDNAVTVGAKLAKLLWELRISQENRGNTSGHRTKHVTNWCSQHSLTTPSSCVPAPAPSGALGVPGKILSLHPYIVTTGLCGLI